MLEDAKLIAYYDAHQADWLALAQKMYDMLETLYPEGSTIRQDDVADYILHALKADKDFRHRLVQLGLKQKYWYAHFTDLIVDRCWAVISAGDEDV
jgi:hypothetical protein